MWNVTPNFELPEDFSMKEDADFVFLFHKGKLRRCFNAQMAAPGNILKECEEITKEQI